MPIPKSTGFTGCALDAGLLHLSVAGVLDPARWIELERVLADFVTLRRRPNRLHAVLIDLRGATMDPCLTAEFLVEQMRMADPARYRPRTILLPAPAPQNNAGGGRGVYPYSMPIWTEVASRAARAGRIVSVFIDPSLALVHAKERAAAQRAILIEAVRRKPTVARAAAAAVQPARLNRRADPAP